MENEILQQILTELKELRQGQNETNARLDTMQEDIAVIQEDIVILKEDSAATRSATNRLIEWAEGVELVTHVKLFPEKKM